MHRHACTLSNGGDGNRVGCGLISVGLYGVITEDHVKDGDSVLFHHLKPVQQHLKSTMKSRKQYKRAVKRAHKIVNSYLQNTNSRACKSIAYSHRTHGSMIRGSLLCVITEAHVKDGD